MSSELREVSNKILKNLKKINPNSFLAWVSGTAIDYWKNVKLNDYDIIVYGASKKKVAQILKREFGSVNSESDSLVLNSWAPSGKRIDVMILSIFEFSMKQKNWKLSKNYAEFLLNKKNVNPYQLLRTNQESGTPRFSNRGLCFLFPSMKKVTKQKWINDIKNMNCQMVRYESRYVFYDYMRLFRFCSMGYSLDKKTKKLMVDNSLFEFLVWNDKNVEPDRLSEYQDSLLKYILKVFEQEDRGLKCKPESFFNLCVETSLFEFLFSQTPSKVKKVKTPEDFLCKIFSNKEQIEKTLGDQFIFNENYNFS